MTKTELVSEISGLTDISEKGVNKVLRQLTLSMFKSLEEGDSISLPGIGTFLIKDRKARIGRNPQTGEKVTIPARKVPIFKAASALKDAVNKK